MIPTGFVHFDTSVEMQVYHVICVVSYVHNMIHISFVHLDTMLAMQVFHVICVIGRTWFAKMILIQV